MYKNIYTKRENENKSTMSESASGDREEAGKRREIARDGREGEGESCKCGCPGNCEKKPHPPKMY